MVRDMTSGNPTKLIFSFAVPMLIGNVFQQFYNMVDAIIVGRFVGVNALAAVGATGAMSFLILGFVIGLTVGFSVIVSQRFGANDEAGLRQAVTMSVLLSIVGTIVITTASMLSARTLLEFMKTPKDIIDDAFIYIFIICGGIFATIFYNLLSAILRALGDSKTPLIFLIISSIINVVLDILFVKTFNMGVAGAAYATVAAQAISGVMCLFYINKKYPILHLHKSDWAINWQTIFQLLKLGLPTAIQNSVTAVGVMIVQTAVNLLGS
ncbi:MAG: MATE family efflux transporter, partial [Oscillospiraceae bacterium]